MILTQAHHVRGRDPVFAPGLFGKQSGQADLFASLGRVKAGLLATPIGLFLKLQHALPYMAFVVWRLRRPRSAAPLDLMLVLVMPLVLIAALTMGMREPEGKISALAVFVALGEGLVVVHESEGVRVWRYGPPPVLGRLVASEGLR